MNHSESIEKLRDLIKGINIAMFVTMDKDGAMHGRPMGTQQTEFDGDLWFFTGKSTGKIDELEREPHVTVQYQDASANKYVSVSGKASIHDDKAKIEELWNPFLKAWFPDGKDDPEITLIKVSVEKAEYWDAPNGKVATLIGFMKAMATGKQADDIAENEQLNLK